MSKSPVREGIYFTYGDTLTALDLTTLSTRPLFTRPKSYVGSSADATADGKYICAGCTQDLSDRFMVDLGNGYFGFNEYWEAHPHPMIYKILHFGKELAG